MKLIIRQYLAGLKERGELDAILPDLLSQMGLNVYSRPARGTRQDGVDVAAVGSIDEGPDKVYLFSVKSGDLTRKEWDGDNIQSLRPSLNEILDAYIPNRIPPEHKDKEVVICPTFGGDVQEQVRLPLVGFMNSSAKPGRISFEEWNGDKLADLIQSHLLREDLIGEQQRADLRRSLALLEEPESAFGYFANLVRSLDGDFANDDARVRAIRQLSVCLWILFSWSRDADNLECAYCGAELALLRGWNICRAFAGKNSKASAAAASSFTAIFEVYRQISIAYLTKIAPHIKHEHALSTAVHGGSSVDANLKLFDLLGRIAIGGIWSCRALLECTESDPARVGLELEVTTAAKAIALLIKTNPSLNAPMKDDQAIEVALAAILLLFANEDQSLREWINEMLARVRFAFTANLKYPSILGSYRELLEHPASKDKKYLEHATSASLLYPVLAHIAATRQDETLFATVDQLRNDFLQHCNFQLWFPDDATEEGLYENKDLHGIALCDVSLKGGVATFQAMIASECKHFPQYSSLSCVKNGWSPLVLVACRHYRLPIPPQLLQLFSNATETETTAEQRPNPREPDTPKDSLLGVPPSGTENSNGRPRQAP
jgi:hypothetical protein